MIFLNFTNPPQPFAGAEIDIIATASRVAAAYPGFPGYIFHNPDQWNAEGEMGYAYGLDGTDWKACHSLLGNLWARLGGCKPHDLPPRDGAIDTLAKRLRPSTAVLLDYGSGQDAQADYERFSRVFQDPARGNRLIVAPEANAKRAYIVPGANTWIVGEWFHFNDATVPNSVNDCDGDRWGVREWLAAHPETKVIVEVISKSRKNLGYAPTASNPNPCPDWPAAKIAIARAFHAVDPQRVIVSVRADGKWTAAQLAELKALNA